MFRWQATVFYRSELGTTDVVHYLEEMDELEMLVERGPNFYTIDRIETAVSCTA
jgi:hypothetical protein